VNDKADYFSVGAALSPAVTLQRLQIFVAVTSRGSFQRAAQHLNLAQATVSDHISALETALGLTLFDRTRGGKSAEQTRAATEILPQAVHLLQSAERLQEFARGIDDDGSANVGVLSIACYPVHLENFLAPLLGQFRHLNPSVRLDLSRVRDDRRRNVGRSLFDELREGQVDLAMGPPQNPADGLEGIHVYDARIVLLVPDDHPNRHSKTVPITLLRDQPVLAAPPGYFSREKITNAARDAGFDLRVEIESASPAALIALGMSGVGIPVVPDDYRAVRDDRFAYPTLTDRQGRELLTPVALQWRREEHSSASQTEFLVLAKEAAEDAGFGEPIYPTPDETQPP
jgi:molybdate transport repressor ModE-like protein